MRTSWFGVCGNCLLRLKPVSTPEYKTVRRNSSPYPRVVRLSSALRLAVRHQVFRGDDAHHFFGAGDARGHLQKRGAPDVEHALLDGLPADFLHRIPLVDQTADFPRHSEELEHA